MIIHDDSNNKSDGNNTNFNNYHYSNNRSNTKINDDNSIN